MSIVDDYREQLDGAAREALRDAAARHPSATVGELRGLIAANPGLGAMTLGELVQGQRPSAGRGRGQVRRLLDSLQAADAKRAEPSRAAKPKAHDVRTEAGRAALDKAICDAIAGFGGVEVSAEAIRARVGGTPAQIRTSLNRQIAAGTLSFSGKARGTRYSLAD